MKRYIKELILLFAQLLTFYVLPLFAGPADMMGLVFLIIIITFALAVLMGVLSGNKVKYFYPLVVAAVFVPSVFIYYNETALVHAEWYLVISFVGLVIGAIMRKVFKRK